MAKWKMPFRQPRACTVKVFLIFFKFLINESKGPMREVSLVGKRGEESGENQAEYNRILEKSIPFLKYVLPWGKMSIIKSPDDSDDGPIWWVRPGEQR